MQNKTLRLIRFFCSTYHLGFLLCLQFNAAASPLIENINNFDDFSVKDVNALAQDQDGFLWIASPNGLFRYDGDSVKRFVHKVDEPGSLADNWIVDVVADNQGYLWIISRGQGLSRFDTVEETFVHFSHVPGDVTTLDCNELNSVTLTPNNLLWIGSKRGLNLFNTQTLTNRRFDPGMRFGNERRASTGAIRPSYWATAMASAFYVLLGSLGLAFYYLKRVGVDRHHKIVIATDESSGPTPQKPSLKKATILVIEDSGGKPQQLPVCLDEAFVCILTHVNTHNNVDIIAQIREQMPDLIIFNTEAKQLRSDELAIALKRNPDTRSIPSISLTDFGVENPFNATNLVLRINHLLSNYRVLAKRHQKTIKPVNNVSNVTQIKSGTKDNTIFAPSKIEGKTVDLKVAEEIKASQLKQKFILLLDKVLEKNYRDSHFDVTRFAGGMLTSKRQLNRKTHTMVDMSPAEAIRNFRLKKAAEQLISGVSPSCVCYEVGFTSHSYFSSCFKAKYHCLPCNYMAIALEAAQLETGEGGEKQP